ncbi:MAG: hypothetical protein MZU91_11450 [Desulfosudis oleivorans]|nr:hypothetical protein [Desulfosudis oleivorans]
MIQSCVVTLYGLVLAVVCLIPAMKLAGQVAAAGVVRRHRTAAGRGPPSSERMTRLRPLRRDRARADHLPSWSGGYPQAGPLPLGQGAPPRPGDPRRLRRRDRPGPLHGRGAGARALTLGFGMTGLIALLHGAHPGPVRLRPREHPGDRRRRSPSSSPRSSFALLGLGRRRRAARGPRGHGRPAGQAGAVQPDVLDRACPSWPSSSSS